jgi:hypothetical protein
MAQVATKIERNSKLASSLPGWRQNGRFLTDAEHRHEVVLIGSQGGNLGDKKTNRGVVL